VHRASPLPALVGAHAFAYGEHVYLAAGDEGALAHEAWHVVQQMQGRVEATGEVNGLPLNDDAALEAEADCMAARAMHSATAAQRTPCGRERKRVDAPVVQRYITVGGPYNTLTTAEAIRQKLNIWYAMNANNTPQFNRAVDALLAARGNYANLGEVRDEVKRRSFGLRHVLNMRGLRLRGTADRTGLSVDQVSRWCARYRAPAPGGLATLYGTRPAVRNFGTPAQVSGHPPFVTWYVLSDFARARTTADHRLKEIFKWVTGQQVDAARPDPRLMNCYEAVVYGATWTDGQRQPLFTPAYAYWALRTLSMPTATFGNAANQQHRCAQFVQHIVNGNYEHHSTSALNAVGGLPAVPATVIPGLVVIFNCGEHVALATGQRQRNGVAPGFGHQVIELDQQSRGVEYSTIEDLLRSYGRELHLGWLPEKTVQETMTLTANDGTVVAQVVVPATHFYD
jgi:hypothetical protein